MNDDELGALLLRPLAGEPSGVPGIDVPKAMRNGLRMRRRRWWLGGPALIATVTAALVGGGLLLSPVQQRKPEIPLPPDPPLPAACTVDQLPMGGAKSAEVTSGDSSGRWLAGRSDPFFGQEKTSKVLVWHDGKLVGTARDGNNAISLKAINSVGVGVGFGDINKMPYVYRDGKLTKLKGGTGEGTAINDAGTIVGVLGQNAQSHPVRWASPDAEPEPLELPDGADQGFDRMYAITPDGIVLGTAGRDLYMWLPDGTRQRVTPPKLPPVSLPPESRGPNAPTSGVAPVGYSRGWVYAMVSQGNVIDNPLYRYHIASGTWQKVAGNALDGQFPIGSLMSMSQDQAKVWVGRKLLTLPQHEPSQRAEINSYSVNAVSDDVHVIGGTALSGSADVSLPVHPLIWRCR
jgi:hypothetical protein